MYAIINGKIIDGHKLIKNQAIIIEQNIIAKIVSLQDVPTTLEKVDVQGAYIAPGFIDLQVNGCGGVLFNDDISLQTIETMLETNLKFGCTSFLPTLISSSKEDITKALDVTKDAYKLMPNNVLGAHIEGPYISKIKKGIHDEQYIRPLNEEETNIFRNKVKEVPIMLTIAPEVNDLGLVVNLLQSGVKVSMGHTNANYKEAMEVIDLGVNHATHLFNAMAPLHHRDSGVTAAVLNNQSVSTGMIMDGMHVDFNVIKLVKQVKGENLYIVTDAATPAGTKDVTKFKFGGKDLVVVNGKALDKNGTLGGSLITMIESVYNAAEILGFGLIEAVRMASLYPARIMNCHHKLGLIKHGYIANLAIFDCDYNMRYTVNGGKLLKLY